jgi:hypothetical protein
MSAEKILITAVALLMSLMLGAVGWLIYRLRKNHQIDHERAEESLRAMHESLKRPPTKI